MTLALQQVSKRFGAIDALRELSFTVETGEAVAFLGPNGAGKTTAMRLLAGWFDADAGEVWVHGKKVRRGHPPRGLGYLPEHNPLRADQTVLETLRFAGRMLGLSGEDLSRAVMAAAARCRLESLLSRPCGTLSKGMRQRTGLARALLGEPRLLILDEPTTGLDPNQTVEIETMLGDLRGEVTLLLSTHLLHRLPLWCDRALMIDQGALVFDGPPHQFFHHRESNAMDLTVDQPPESVKVLADKQSAVTGVALLVQSGDTYRYRLSCNPSERGTVLRAMVEAGWQVHAWAPVEASPEAVFAARCGEAP